MGGVRGQHFGLRHPDSEGGGGISINHKVPPREEPITCCRGGNIKIWHVVVHLLPTAQLESCLTGRIDVKPAGDHPEFLRISSLMVPSTDPYRYTLLSHVESQVVIVASGQEERSIKCSLIIEDTKLNLLHEAISYTWEDPNNTMSILCNGKKMSVTVSLWTALQRMRSPNETRRLWADVICINQQDLQEREQQVGMMGTIHSNAKSVLVWLGPDEKDEAQECFDSIVKIAEEARSKAKAYGGKEIPRCPK